MHALASVRGSARRLGIGAAAVIVLLLGGGLAAASIAQRDDDPEAPIRDVVETLGARDGYLFVFNPYNCTLREAEIEMMRELGARSRRSGKVLTLGHDVGDSTAARRAAEDMGVTLPVGSYASTRLRGSRFMRTIGSPAVIAIRNGQVIATLSGEDFKRSAAWIRWLEHQAVARGSVSDQE